MELPGVCFKGFCFIGRLGLLQGGRARLWSLLWHSHIYTHDIQLLDKLCNGRLLPCKFVEGAADFLTELGQLLLVLMPGGHLRVHELLHLDHTRLDYECNALETIS